jgi:hypothetical protein
MTVMGRKKVYNDLKSINIRIENVDYNKLKKSSVNLNKFFRQSIKAWEEGKWDYEPMED